MAVLKFVCPATDNEVDTGLDLDARSFADPRRDRTADPLRTALGVIISLTSDHRRGVEPAKTSLLPSNVSPGARVRTKECS